MSTEETPAKKPRTAQNGSLDLKSLATQYYEISYGTLRNKILHIAKKLEALANKTAYIDPKTKKRVKGNSRVLNIKQIDLIVKEIGEPYNYKWTGKKFIPDEQ